MFEDNDSTQEKLQIIEDQSQMTQLPSGLLQLECCSKSSDDKRSIELDEEVFSEQGSKGFKPLGMRRVQRFHNLDQRSGRLSSSRENSLNGTSSSQTSDVYKFLRGESNAEHDSNNRFSSGVRMRGEINSNVFGEQK